MRHTRVKVALAVATLGVVGVGAVAVARDGRNVRETLSGYEEVPALSTPGVGEFRAGINRAATEIEYVLSFDNTETDVTQAHIHFENRTNNGSIVVFLCTNLGNAPVGVPTPQACPPGGGTIRGTLAAADVGPGAGFGVALAGVGSLGSSGRMRDTRFLSE